MTPTPPKTPVTATLSAPSGETPATPATIQLPSRYVDQGRIASGGMGEVRRVYDQRLERMLAMKVILPTLAPRADIRERFVREARLTAGLQHPGIVAVHDVGQLADGRWWFTMKEVQGKTLGSLLTEPSTESWPLRRWLDGFVKVSQAVAYAHERGVIHRDLKPSNIMFGSFGEVLVMDWGIASLLAWGNTCPTAIDRLTVEGRVMGTPPFMPPEQWQAQAHTQQPTMDVYALGAILALLLNTGTRHNTLPNTPADWADIARNSGGPEPLVRIALRALSPLPSDRFSNASELAAEAAGWTEGAKQKALAEGLVERAEAHRLAMVDALASSRRWKDLARQRSESLATHSPVDLKAACWEAEDEATSALHRATQEELDMVNLLHAALNQAPGFELPRRRLAAHYRQTLEHLEATGESAIEVMRAESKLRVFDDGQHAEFLAGTGRVSWVTEVPYDVEVYPLLERRRRWVLGEPRQLGTVTRVHISVPRGRYLVRFEGADGVSVQYPIVVGRGGVWQNLPPGAKAPSALRLPQGRGSTDPLAVFIPQGWFLAGGDEAAPESLPSQRWWCDGFWIQRDPVTHREYLEFINALVERGQAEAAAAACPQDGATDGRGLGYHRRGDGVYELGEEAADWPVVRIRWHDAMAYAAWRETVTGLPWRLPHELEWEKAARGVDGRHMPWGDFPEPTWARMLPGQVDVPTRGSVSDYPTDVSPYGVRGMAGNCRDWCLNPYERQGPPRGDGRVQLSGTEPPDADAFRMVKGGSWGSVVHYCRAAARFANRPSMRSKHIGFRLARSARPEIDVE